jgi:hypothetical protein
MKFRYLFFLVLSLFVEVESSFARDLSPFLITPDGRRYGMNLGPNEKDLDNISVYFYSEGNISNSIAVEVTGPSGIVGTARGGSIGTRDGLAALTSNASIIQSYTARQYPNYEDQPTFDTVSSGNDPMYGYVGAFADIHKDACAPKSSRYVVQVNLNLSKVDRSYFDQGFSLTLSVSERKFVGTTWASIKPKSDGQYHGEPILLMGIVGYGNERVNKQTWRGGKIVATTQLPIVKYVSWHGKGLSLARIKDVLRGGKHTWELTDGKQVYGVCLKAERTRQKVNGYP